MFQYVLPVACTEFQPAEDLDQIRVESVNADFKRRLLTHFPDIVINLTAGFFNHFFNARRVNTAILNEFIKSDSCRLPSDRIKSGKNDCFRCVINNQVNTCKRFKRTNVTPFTADDTSFHLIIRKIDDRYRRFGNMISLHSGAKQATECFSPFYLPLLSHGFRFLLS